MTDVEALVSTIRERLSAAASEVDSAARLQDLRSTFLGRKSGLLTSALKGLGGLPPEARGAAGKLVNDLKREVEERLAGLEAELRNRAAPNNHAAERDLTLPGAAHRPGTRHPLSLIREELEEIFLELGYSIAEGPEVDDELHCFEALNIPRDHPSRDMQDTLYVGGGLALRPHTSSVRIRTMERQQPPIRVIATGRCYRKDTPDATHSPMFHQIEGLVVDEGITLGHLKGTLEHLSRRLFTASTTIRLRPSFFPFTEPSAELDISCFACAMRGCGLCKQSGFIEMGGCGMVDPNVFAGLGIDAERFTGFAFGFGIERIAMLKHGIDNIRLFFENDLRFLNQFPSLV